VQYVEGTQLINPSCAQRDLIAMTFCDLGLKYTLWQRLRRCLLHDVTKDALIAALSSSTDTLRQRTAVLAALKACEKRVLANTRSATDHMLDSIMAYLERLVAPGLPWELRRLEKGLGLYIKGDCSVTLTAIRKQLGRAEVVELTKVQWERERAYVGQQCLVKAGGRLGVIIGPVALLNKPCSGCTPHLLLCNLPSVSAFERSKQSRRKVLQSNLQEQPHTSNAEQLLLLAGTQLQQGPSTRGSGQKPLSCKAIAAAEAQSRLDLVFAAGKRKLSVSNNTILSRDRLLPQMSVRLHSSNKGGRLCLRARQELLLGYGNAYGEFDT
jgi:hypothetical protein